MTLNVLVFSGTTEGRNVSEYLAKHGVNVTASVATEYGNIVMHDIEKLCVRVGRLDLQAMIEIVKKFPLVIDATHPYATEVTSNIRDACDAARVEYVRLIRPSSEQSDAILVESARAAVEFLNGTSGNILITTGSKGVCEFANIENYQKRCFARVLPTIASIEACHAIGLAGENIICMQGPFSHLMNLATIKETHAEYLVTKDSGTVGGFEEKLSAAKEAGIKVVLIARPVEETGVTYNQLITTLNRRFGLEKENSGYMPIFIDISGQNIIIIGGGKIAARRAEVLLQFGARVTVISPEICCDMHKLLVGENANWQKKEYENGDINGAILVVCATDNRTVNHEAAQETQKKGIPVSVADEKSECTFYFPAIVKGGGVIGGFVSIGGENHNIVKEKAAQIRRALNESSK